MLFPVRLGKPLPDLPSGVEAIRGSASSFLEEIRERLVLAFGADSRWWLKLPRGESPGARTDVELALVGFESLSTLVGRSPVGTTLEEKLWTGYLSGELAGAEVLRRIQRFGEVPLRDLARSIDTTGPGDPIVVFNPLPWWRVAPVRIPKESVHIVDSRGEPVPMQSTFEDQLTFLATVPSFGYRVYFKVPPEEGRPSPGTGLTRSGFELANRLVRVGIDLETGHVASLRWRERDLLKGSRIQRGNCRPLARVRLPGIGGGNSCLHRIEARYIRVKPGDR